VPNLVPLTIIVKSPNRLSTNQRDFLLAQVIVLPFRRAGAVLSMPRECVLEAILNKLPDELQGIGDVWLRISLRGVQSNKVQTKIR